MNLSSRSIAENASFSAFMNCYLREIDPGNWQLNKPSVNGVLYAEEAPWCVDLTLRDIKQRIRLYVSYRSLVGRHTITDVFTQSFRGNSDEDGLGWVQAEKLQVLISVIQNIYKDKKRAIQFGWEGLEKLKFQETELLARLIDSYQLMAHYIESRKNDSSLTDLNFLKSEQSSLYGHWMHPTPKSRQGMAFWQQSSYSPELQGSFKLHYFSVDMHLVTQGSVLDQSASELIFSEVNKHESTEIDSNHVLIPQHPLQAQFLLLSNEVRSLMADGKIQYLGERGPAFTPSSSVRTLYCESSQWMYKFSIPVKITNSLRSNMKDELEDGMEVEKFLRKVGFFDARPQFQVVDDPAYITVNLPSNPNKESGFEVVIRRNLVFGKPENKICSILSLVQDPIPVDNIRQSESLLKKVIKEIALNEGRNERVVARDWFSKYFECAIESLVLLYDAHGIALEAHLQNSLLDLSDGYPSVYFYRDNQGFYLSKHYADTLKVIDDSLTMSEMFYDDGKIFEAIAYYVFFNQLFAVMHRLGVDGLVLEPDLIDLVRSRLIELKKRLSGIGLSFVDYMLEQHVIACKTNLLARINDVDELHQGMETAVYAQVLNPLVGSSKEDLVSSQGEMLPGRSMVSEEGCHAV